MPLFNFSLSDSKINCPDCGREFQGAKDEKTWDCLGCHSSFEVDAQGQLRRIPSVVAVKQFRGILQQLDNLETVGWRMLHGIGHFLTSTMWSWMRKQLILLGEISVKAVRVAMVFACWGAISFAPLWLVAKLESKGWPVFVALGWTGLALGGSLWGARYIRHRLQPRRPGLLRRIIHWRRKPKPTPEKPPVEANSSDWFPFDKPKENKGYVEVN